MLSAADLAQMQADTLEIIEDNEVSIAIRRGSSTLATQIVRVERIGRSRSRKVQGAASEESRVDILVVGETDLDIAKDDRFTIGGDLYQVTFVLPNRQVDTQAEAEMVR